MAEQRKVAGRALHVDVIGGGRGDGLGVACLESGVSGTADNICGVVGMPFENGTILCSLRELNGSLNALDAGDSGEALVRGEDSVA